jgi:hypothetical protein
MKSNSGLGTAKGFKGMDYEKSQGHYLVAWGFDFSI